MKKIYIIIFTLIFLTIGIIANAQSARDRRQATDLINSGKEDIKNGNYDAAIEKLTEAIRLNPKEIDGFYQRANAYQLKGDYDSAIADLSKKIKNNPKETYALIRRGFAYEGARKGA